MNIRDKEWLFFDVGNIILNDDPGVAFGYKIIHDEVLEKGIDISFDDFLTERDRFFQQRGMTLPRALGKKYLTDAEAERAHERFVREAYEMWGDLNPLIPGADGFIKDVSGHYKLGLIANQPAVCGDVLDKLGLLKYFRVHGLSDAVGKKKPDTEFFKWALEQGKTVSENAIMLGDRVDNDVAPAKSLGFTTIHFTLNVYDKLEGHPISEITRTYLPHVHEYNISMRKPVSEVEEPHYSVTSFDELRKLLIHGS